MSEVAIYGQTHCMNCNKKFRRGHAGITFRQGTMCSSCIVKKLEENQKLKEELAEVYHTLGIKEKN